METGLLEEAERKFNDCLRERKDIATNYRRAFEYRRLGDVYLVTGRIREAEEAIKEALDISIRGGNWRHAFATYAVEATGNIFAVADAMGHEDLKTTRIYQHPELGAIRDAIDQRNNRRVM